MSASRRVRSPFILALASEEADLERAGGKGASLARMAAAGLAVPPGFHVTTDAYRRFVAENDLGGAIGKALAEANPREPATLDAASARIHDLFATARTPADVANAIRGAYAELGSPGEAVAVRSSATAEDLPEMSFAGQQETFLNVSGEEALLDAVRRCWASLWTARAIGYRASHDIPNDGVSIAVVVQRLVAAEAAGVLFTANPVSGARDEFVINAAWGLGEAVVGGLVTPDNFVVDRRTGALRTEEIADKTTMTVRTATGTTEEPVPDAMRRRPALGATEIAALAEAGDRIEALYGRPMDVEWAVAGGQVHLLQARPITALPAEAPAPPLEWRLPDPKGRYARASAIELLPDPLSPLFATLGLPEWGKTMGGEMPRLLGIEGAIDSQAFAAAGEHIFTTINDYAFYDIGFLTGWMGRLLPALPRMARNVGPLLSKSDSRWAKEARPRYAALIAEWEGRDLTSIPATELLRGARDIVVEAARHYLSIQAGILPAAYMSEALFTYAYEKAIRRRGDPPALTFLLGYASTPIRAEQSAYDLARWARAQGPLREYLARTPGAEIATDVLDSRSEVAEVGEAWPEFRHRLAAHLARFGAAIYDLDFAKPTVADDPAPLVEAVKFFLSEEAPNPYDRQARAEAERERATRTVLARLRGPRLALFRRTLSLAQRFAPLREDALADTGLGWPVLRRMLAEVGRRLVEAGAIATADDVYWLRYEELRADVEALDGGRMPAEHRVAVVERRALWNEERKLTPPVSLPGKEGMRFLGFDWSAFAPARTDQGPGGAIKGIGTSPGRVAGTARVIHGPEEFSQMRPGDILVARITTPAWTPLFALAGGVVTDVGGPLSHSSIVAREYQIPAVLGTGVATERIRSGQRITVDGDAGTVTLPDDAVSLLGARPTVSAGAGDAKSPPGRARWIGLLVAIVALAGLWRWRARRVATRRRG